MNRAKSGREGFFSAFRSEGIGRRFAVYILLFSSVITLVITAIQLMLDYERDVRVVENRLYEIEVVYRDTLSTAVWVHNDEGLHLQLVGMLRLPDMLYVQVSDEHGVPVATLGKAQLQLIIERSFPLSYLHRGKLVPLGSVRITADLGAVYQRLIDKVMVILISQTIKTFLVSLFILGLFYRLVGRHLHHLAEAAHEIAAGSLALLPDKTRDDELGALADALNHMIAALSRSGEEMGQMAMVMAHQFQEPARLMALFAQRLRKTVGDGLADSSARESIDFIESESRRLRSLVNDMQRYLNYWQIWPRTALVDSASVFQAVLFRFGDAMREANAGISVDALPPVQIDPQRLSDLFALLLDNSVKHRHPDRPLSIHLSVAGSGKRAVFRFADNGPGIPEEYRDKVFKLFERLSSGQSGTGVGLPVVRRIVEGAGGHVHIEDSAGGGICVVFDLPRGEAPPGSETDRHP